MTVAGNTLELRHDWEEREIEAADALPLPESIFRAQRSERSR